MPHRSREGANQDQREDEGITRRGADEQRQAGDEKRRREVRWRQQSSGSSFLPTAERFSSTHTTELSMASPELTSPELIQDSGE